MLTIALISHLIIALIVFALVIEQDNRHGSKLTPPWLLAYAITCLIFWPAMLFFYYLEWKDQRKENGGGE